MESPLQREKPLRPVNSGWFVVIRMAFGDPKRRVGGRKRLRDLNLEAPSAPRPQLGGPKRAKDSKLEAQS